MPPEVQTLTISNFGGRLTRNINGDINSGFANFKESWGYDPFSKPGNLMWVSQPTDIKGSVITDAIYAGTYNFLNRFVFLGNAGRLYEIQATNGVTDDPLNDSPSLVASFNAGNFIFGGNIIEGLTPISNTQSILGTSDNKLFKISSDGAAFSVLGTFFNNTTGGLNHPMIKFLGKTYIGDENNLWEVTNFSVSKTAVLSPALPENLRIVDLDLTPEGDYMIITATRTGTAPLDRSTGTLKSNNAGDSYLFYWNGTDQGATAVKTLPSWPTSAFQNFLDKQYTTQQDTFGMALYEGNTKLLTLPNNVFPTPNAFNSNGNFLTWTSPEGTGNVNSSTPFSSTFTSLYYFGQLDQENPAGLYRMLRIAPTSSVAYSSAYNGLINNFYQQGAAIMGWGKHYITTQEINSSGTSAVTHFYRWVLNPAANTNPVLGVYQTQTQLFSKRIKIIEIRVYTEPTVAGNAFRLDLIGAGGDIIDNGTFNYIFGEISDPQSGSTSLERINFDPDVKSQYSVGVRITNAGTTNMVIKKIEIDYSEQGK